MKIKDDKLLIRRNLNILKFIYNIIFIIILLVSVFCIENNRILISISIILVYLNSILFFKFVINTVRVTLTWRNIEEYIEGIESGKESIEDIQKKLIGNDIEKYCLGKQYGKIADETKAILDRVTESINNINKNEKMNIDLVNNVTNKLDKPLEDIIKNIEKLKKCNEDKGAIKNIKDKSSNMRILIDELFEAAKVSSGDINLEVYKIEVTALLKQAFIEYKDKIDSSTILYKINIPKEKVYIKSNGEKMWRVFDILIQNTLKHSLDKSRVYIDLFEKEANVYIRFRNISKNELNIEAKELISVINKNKEADRSGLGLEIAKNLVHLQNGKFDLDIKGDLFTVLISFPIYIGDGEDNDK